MSENRFKFPRTPDVQIVKIFIELGKTFSIPNASVVACTGINISVDLLDDSPNLQLNQITALDSHLIETVQLSHHDLHIAYFRGGCGQPQDKSPVYDEISLSFTDNKATPSVQERIAIAAMLMEKFKRTELGRITPADVSPDIQHVLAIHQSNLSRLEGLNEDLIKRSAEFRDDLERRFETKVSENDLKLANKEAELLISQ